MLSRLPIPPFVYNQLAKSKLLVRIVSRFNQRDENIGRRYSTTRFQMYNSLEKYIKGHKLHGKVLMLSEGNEHSIRNMFSGKCEFISTCFPETNIMKMSKFKNSSFDIVVTDQVLEHVPNPFVAVSEIYRVLKKGGVAINTSCSFNPIHDKVDYFRYTKDGFLQIHSIFKKILLLETWGNRQAIGNFSLHGYKSFDVRRRQSDLKSASINDPVWPWSVWCVAQK